MKTKQTIGEVRREVAKMGNRAWTVASQLRDDDPVPHFALGGIADYHPRAADVRAVDFQRLLSRPLGNPLLAARNQQLQVILWDLLAMPGVDWRDRWGGRWLCTIQNQNPCNNCWAFATIRRAIRPARILSATAEAIVRRNPNPGSNTNPESNVPAAAPRVLTQ